MPILRKALFLLGFSMFWATMLSACANFNPQPMAKIPFRDRAQIQIKENVCVKASVLSL